MHNAASLQLEKRCAMQQENWRELCYAVGNVTSTSRLWRVIQIYEPDLLYRNVGVESVVRGKCGGGAKVGGKSSQETRFFLHSKIYFKEQGD
jgi:hypothetical protein